MSSDSSGFGHEGSDGKTTCAVPCTSCPICLDLTSMGVTSSEGTRGVIPTLTRGPVLASSLNLGGGGDRQLHLVLHS